jgi:hypothetical protein
MRAQAPGAGSARGVLLHALGMGAAHERRAPIAGSHAGPRAPRMRPIPHLATSMVGRAPLGWALQSARRHAAWGRGTGVARGRFKRPAAPGGGERLRRRRARIVARGRMRPAACARGHRHRARAAPGRARGRERARGAAQGAAVAGPRHRGARRARARRARARRRRRPRPRPHPVRLESARGPGRPARPSPTRPRAPPGVPRPRGEVRRAWLDGGPPAGARPGTTPDRTWSVPCRPRGRAWVAPGGWRARSAIATRRASRGTGCLKPRDGPRF